MGLINMVLMQYECCCLAVPKLNFQLCIDEYLQRTERWLKDDCKCNNITVNQFKQMVAITHPQSKPFQSAWKWVLSRMYRNVFALYLITYSG